MLKLQKTAALQNRRTATHNTQHFTLNTIFHITATLQTRSTASPQHIIFKT